MEAKTVIVPKAKIDVILDILEEGSENKLIFTAVGEMRAYLIDLIDAVREEAYSMGLAEGRAEPNDEIYEQGRAAGYEEGFRDGQEENAAEYQRGVDDGREEAATEAYEEGHAEGRAEGYADGYEQAKLDYSETNED